MRWILIVLVILNVAALAWFLRAGSASGPAVAPAPDDAVPELVLLSEVRAPAVSAVPSSAERPPVTNNNQTNNPGESDFGESDVDESDVDESDAGDGEVASVATVEPARPGPAPAPPMVADGRCHALGPFPASEDVESFISAFGQDFVLTPERQPKQIRTNYRVYLPPAANREAAQTAFEELRSRLASSGLNFESFLIARGELANGIALGLFSEQRNAQNVQAQLATIGYQAVIAEEPVYQDELWVRLLERAGGANFQSRWAQMQAGRPWLQGLEKLC